MRGDRARRARKAWTTIAEVARGEQADLIAIGVQGRGAIDLMVFGSTAHHVIREGVCPVLTIRAA